QGQSAIQAAESLSKYELKNILYAKMHKSHSHLTRDIHQELYDALTWSMLLDEATMKGGDKPDTVLKKRDYGDDQDEDPSAGSNQGKMTKKRRFNESESSKKTSTHITRADLAGPVFNLLKGTCKSCVELEYNMEECYYTLTDQLDCANPEGHKSPVDMSKPLPLQDKEDRLIILVEFFFNNDLE
ncbi:hypothetical protein Tco_0108252, partial [Tanacetum coccineum]